MSVVQIPAELGPVLELLPAPVHELRPLIGPGRPWFVRYGSDVAVLRWNDPARYGRAQFATEIARASIDWLHSFLRDLATTGFVAPMPVPHLKGESIAVIDGGISELLSFVPGEPLGWAGTDELHQTGRLLAQFHDASLALPGRTQRPGSLPLNDCRPTHPDAHAIAAKFDQELERVGHATAPRAVVHGDATNANVVRAGAGLRLVDFALAYQEALLFDIGSALWRNARPSADAVTYDPRRAAQFVRGYHSCRSLSAADSRAIVVYLMARGLQLQHRLELRAGTDATVTQRLRSIHRQRAELEDALGAAI